MNARSFLKRAPVVSVLPLLVGASSPQAPQPRTTPPAKPPIVFGVEISYVEVDAIVTDKNGTRSVV